MELEEQVYISIQNNEPIVKIVKLCEEFSDGLHVCSIHKSTVLHLAIYHGKYKLAHKLLDDLNSLDDKIMLLSEKLTSVVDDWGQTLLHCAAVSDHGLQIAKKLVSLAPSLLEKRNQNGETALFLACRYGQLIMFKFLADQVDSYCIQNLNNRKKDDFLRRSQDGINVLHITVLQRSFDLALIIVDRYPNLCEQRCAEGKTALQMLACCPTEFLSGSRPKLGPINRFIYTRMLKEVDDDQNYNKSTKVKAICKACTKLACVQKMIQLRRQHMNALKLVQVLVKIDDTWKVSSQPKANVNISIKPKTRSSDECIKLDDPPKDEVEQNALLLAAESGCIEIVQAMLKEHPLAIEQLNDKGQNLLHLVIKNRHMHIFEYVTSHHGSSIKWMSTAYDNDGNSILHMVAFLDASQSSVDTGVISPLAQLSADLVLLEELKEKCLPNLTYHHNRKMQTADKMFASNSEKLLNDAKKWLNSIKQQGIVVACLIVTLVFAALFQVPGGQNDEGVPNLIEQPFFPIFTTSDILSFTSALTSIVFFFFIHTSTVELDQFRGLIPFQLFISYTFAFISISMMMITFTSTTILVIRKQTPWGSKIVIYLAACVPVALTVLSYIPLYIHLTTSFIKSVHKFLTQLFLPTKQSVSPEEQV